MRDNFNKTCFVSISNVLAALILLVFFSAGLAHAGSNTSKFPWVMFIPVITASNANTGGGGDDTGEEEKKTSYWGVDTTLCCQTSPLTLSVTIAGETKKSVLSSCATGSTWEGLEDTTAGNNSVDWQITSEKCGSYTGNIQLDMTEDTIYRFQLESVDNNEWEISVIFNAISSQQNSITARSGSRHGDTNGERLLKRIRVNIPPEAWGLGMTCESHR